MRDPFPYETSNRPILKRGEVRILLYGFAFAAGGAVAIAAMHQVGAVAVGAVWLALIGLATAADRMWP